MTGRSATGNSAFGTSCTRKINFFRRFELFRGREERNCIRNERREVGGLVAGQDDHLEIHGEG